MKADSVLRSIHVTPRAVRTCTSFLSSSDDGRSQVFAAFCCIFRTPSAWTWVPIFQPSMTKSSSSSRARGGDAGSQTRRCSATPFGACIGGYGQTFPSPTHAHTLPSYPSPPLPTLLTPSRPPLPFPPLHNTPHHSTPHTHHTHHTHHHPP